MQRNNPRINRIAEPFQNQPTACAASCTRASAAIADAVDPSGILCTTIIDFIHSGVRIACTAANAARSARSCRARRISSKPNPTAVKTVNAVATFAKVERSTRQAYQNLRAQSEVEIRNE